MLTSLLRGVLIPLTVVGLAACETTSPTASSDGDPAGSEIAVFDPVYDFTAPPDGGTCPDVFNEDTELLENGVTLTWTSGLGGFDYTEGTDYVGTVNWSVDQGSAVFDDFTVRSPMPKTWTPVGSSGMNVDGTMTPGAGGDGTVDVTVNMTPMHDVGADPDEPEEDGWMGQIGNGHFWLLLTVDDGEGNEEMVKLGVNFHLEDPAEGFDARCPS